MILRCLATSNISHIQFAGGEPLLNTNVEELFHITVQAMPDIDIGLATNGTLLTPSLSRVLSEYTNNVRINLPTINSERYRKIIGRNDLNQVINSIDMLKSDQAKVGINVVYCGQSARDIIDLLEFATERRIDVKFLEWIPIKSHEKSMPLPNMLQDVVRKFAYKKCELSKSLTIYDIAINNYKTKVRILKNRCALRSEYACKEYPEIRLLPNLELQSCLISNRNNISLDINNSQSIATAFMTAQKKLGICQRSYGQSIQTYI